MIGILLKLRSWYIENLWRVNLTQTYGGCPKENASHEEFQSLPKLIF
jgi:hypothetical protein